MSGFPGADFLVAAIFGAFAAMTAAGALIAVGTARVIRSVCGLALCSLGLAGLYYFLNSPFLALMEILIYIGAVCVTIIFAVMLAEPDESAAPDRPRAGLLWGAVALVVSVFVGAGLAHLSLKGPWPVAPVERVNDGSVATIGTSLLTTYGLAFELISLVIFVAILGALVIARGGRTKP